MQQETEMSTAEVRQELMELLRKFTLFCEQHRLRYFLAYGSLLGAVRAQDLIPWDDDIDVLMPRPDYDRFLSQYRAKPEADTALLAPGDEDYPTPFAKVVSTRTRFEATDYYFPENYGVCLDVFPLDGVPRIGGNALFTAARDTRLVQYRLFPHVKPHLRPTPVSLWNRAKRGAWHIIKEPCGFPSWLQTQLRDARVTLGATISRGSSRAKLAVRADRIISAGDFACAHQVADMVGWHSFKDAVIERRHIETSEWVKFGDLNVRTFQDPETLLEQWYGSDWRIPNPEYKLPHGKAYWRRPAGGEESGRRATAEDLAHGERS